MTNMTTFIGFVTTGIHAISALGVFYYWPVYFQAVKGVNPVRSAIDFFSVAFIVAPFAMVAGGTISATQVYKPQNVIAWGALSFPFPLSFSIHSPFNLNRSSSADISIRNLTNAIL